MTTPPMATEWSYVKSAVDSRLHLTALPYGLSLAPPSFDDPLADQAQQWRLSDEGKLMCKRSKRGPLGVYVTSATSWNMIFSDHPFDTTMWLYEDGAMTVDHHKFRVVKGLALTAPTGGEGLVTLAADDRNARIEQNWQLVTPDEARAAASSPDTKLPPPTEERPEPIADSVDGSKLIRSLQKVEKNVAVGNDSFGGDGGSTSLNAAAEADDGRMLNRTAIVLQHAAGTSKLAIEKGWGWNELFVKIETMANGSVLQRADWDASRDIVPGAGGYLNSNSSLAPRVQFMSPHSRAWKRTFSLRDLQQHTTVRIITSDYRDDDVSPIKTASAALSPVVPPDAVGPPETLGALLEYLGRHNELLQRKVAVLAERGYTSWRRVRGDGSCYYRAIGFGSVLAALLRASASSRASDRGDALRQIHAAFAPLEIRGNGRASTAGTRDSDDTHGALLKWLEECAAHAGDDARMAEFTRDAWLSDHGSEATPARVGTAAAGESESAAAVFERAMQTHGCELDMALVRACRHLAAHEVGERERERKNTPCVATAQ